MTDLAESIATLATAAQRRQVASKRLRQAVATVGRQIDDRMEAGERIDVGDVTYRSVLVTWWVSQWADDSYAYLHPDGGWVFCRDGRALYSPRRGHFDGSNHHDPCSGTGLDGLAEHVIVPGETRPLDGTPEVPWATLDDMRDFAAEASDLVKSLAAKAAADADDRDRTTDAITAAAIASPR